MSKSRYPGFDVMKERDAWDDHTRDIVVRRSADSSAQKQTFRFLRGFEADVLGAVAGHLLYESRDELIRFVVGHFDQKLATEIGESERKIGVPNASTLIRLGIKAVDSVAKHRHGHPFTDCSTDQQFEILASLQKGELEAIPALQGFPQKELFQKMLRLAVESYASHPTVWSEIGYAGPAYPRGYYRIERGLTDPWEATEE